MTRLELKIIEFIQHPDFLNDQDLSETQISILKSYYGLSLNDRELEIYRAATGRQNYPGIEQDEVTIIAGRRSGKTRKIAATIVCFEAFRYHGIPPGEDGYMLLLAPTLAQARIAFRYIGNYLRKSKELFRHIESITGNEIRLDNGIVIGCYPSTHDGVRGRTIVGVIADEFAFWSEGEQAANPAEEVLAAVRPGMVNIPHAKLVKISTPFAKSGLLWEEFEKRNELDFAVWQVATARMNPSLSLKIERARRQDEEKYRREYLAEFVDTVSGWVDPEILNPCIVRGRRQLPYIRHMVYLAAIDQASRHNDFALVILHVSAEGVVVVDFISKWTGTLRAPLPFESVLGQIATITQDYDITVLLGDQFYPDAISQHLLKLGIRYDIQTFGPSTRERIFATLKHLMIQRKIELLAGR
jgi:hypothetical protein